MTILTAQWLLFHFLLHGFSQIRDGFPDPNPGSIYIPITAIADVIAQSEQQAFLQPPCFTPLQFVPNSTVSLSIPFQSNSPMLQFQVNFSIAKTLIISIDSRCFDFLLLKPNYFPFLIASFRYFFLVQMMIILWSN